MGNIVLETTRIERYHITFVYSNPKRYRPTEILSGISKRGGPEQPFISLIIFISNNIYDWIENIYINDKMSISYICIVIILSKSDQINYNMFDWI